MMPTMQEIDELTREWFLGPISDEDFAKLCAAARRGVEADAEIARADEAINMHAADAFREKKRAEKAEAELAALKVERDEAVRREGELRLELRAADAMAKVCDDWVVRKLIDERSALADARLDYGTPYTYKHTKETRNQGDSNEH